MNIPGVVDPLHHLGLGVEDHDAGDGAEYLVLAALMLVLQAGDDGRLDVVAALAIGDAVAAALNHAAQRLGLLHRLQVALDANLS